MILDTIINISITSEGVQMSQAGFGVPMIVGYHTRWNNGDLTRTFFDPADMLADKNDPKKDGFTVDDLLYKAACQLKMQNPSVGMFKIGRRQHEDPRRIKEDLNAIHAADSGFYGLLLDTYPREAILPAANWVETQRMIFGVDLTDDLAFPVPSSDPGESPRAAGKDKESSKDLPKGTASTGATGATVGADPDVENEAEKSKDIATTLLGRGLKRTFCTYHPRPNSFTAAAWMGKLLPTPPGNATWAFKTLTGVDAYTPNATQLTSLKDRNISPYVKMKSLGTTLYGKMASGEYIDVVRGTDWLQARMQERILLLMMKNPKIPYTDKGVDLVRSEIDAQLKEAVGAGVLAYQPKPEVTAPKVIDIPELKRNNRELPDVRFSGRLEGAIHAMEIRGVVSI